MRQLQDGEPPSIAPGMLLFSGIIAAFRAHG